jgi:hypothetical protein
MFFPSAIDWNILNLCILSDIAFENSHLKYHILFYLVLSFTFWDGFTWTRKANVCVFRAQCVGNISAHWLHLHYKPTLLWLHQPVISLLYCNWLCYMFLALQQTVILQTTLQYFIFTSYISLFYLYTTLYALQHECWNSLKTHSIP